MLGESENCVKNKCTMTTAAVAKQRRQRQRTAGGGAGSQQPAAAADRGSRRRATLAGTANMQKICRKYAENMHNMQKNMHNMQKTNTKNMQKICTLCKTCAKKMQRAKPLCNTFKFQYAKMTAGKYAKNVQKYECKTCSLCKNGTNMQNMHRGLC